MIENKVTFCSKGVTFKYDPEQESVQVSIQKNTLGINCPIAKRTVKLDSVSLFGADLFSCTQRSCPFNTNFSLE